MEITLSFLLLVENVLVHLMVIKFLLKSIQFHCIFNNSAARITV